VNGGIEGPIEIEVVDMMGSRKYRNVVSLERTGAEIPVVLNSAVSTGLYVVSVMQGRVIVKKKVLIRN
jgi:hypothetical protein